MSLSFCNLKEKNLKKISVFLSNSVKKPWNIIPHKEYEAIAKTIGDPLILSEFYSEY